MDRRGRDQELQDVGVCMRACEHFSYIPIMALTPVRNSLHICSMCDPWILYGQDQGLYGWWYMQTAALISVSLTVRTEISLDCLSTLAVCSLAMLSTLWTD